MKDGSASEAARAPEGGAEDGPERGAAEADDGTTAHPERFFCDLCGHEMLDRHCKLLCLQCGYQRDCSDP